MISPEVINKLIYTQSAKNCWCQYLGEDSSPEKLPTCGVDWLMLTPVTLLPTFSSVLLYWTNHPYTISSLPATQELCLWWFLASKFLSVEITGRQHKWRESSRSFKTFELQLCYLTAVWPWKMSRTLRRRTWQPTPVFFLENPMVPPEKPHRLQSMGHKSRTWLNQLRMHTGMHAVLILFFNMGEITVVFHRITVRVNEPILQEA